MVPSIPVWRFGSTTLGTVLKALGDLAGARAAYERALAIDEAAYGTEHPSVAIRVNNLGGVLQDLGDLAGARAAYERALAINEKFLPPDHPHNQITRTSLAALNRSEASPNNGDESNGFAEILHLLYQNTFAVLTIRQDMKGDWWNKLGILQNDLKKQEMLKTWRHLPDCCASVLKAALPDALTPRVPDGLIELWQSILQAVAEWNENNA